jgi:hypothetical protein
MARRHTMTEIRRLHGECDDCGPRGWMDLGIKARNRAEDQLGQQRKVEVLR